MSGTNAPQPAATGPAESFDSTVAPPTGNISSIGLPGPNNTEAPIHTGAVNGIDPYFHTQYIALASFTWSTTDNPGKNLWSIPIHPSETHQWLAHLAKMYNAWAGGIDFALKIAGTGFHAGAIMVVRLPPNIPPSSLLTVPSITAFEYTIMDPKMLEVEIKSVMDQRNIMYHYMPLDVADRQTFGGYLAVYCMLPLATSATGATEISIQILARPSRSFMFSQIRPIQQDIVPVAVPSDLEAALDFTKSRTALMKFEELGTLNIWSIASKRVLTYETLNAIKFSQDPMNGYFLPRFQNLQSFEVDSLGSSKIIFTTDKEQPNITLDFDAGDSILAWNKMTIKGSKTQIPIIKGEGAIFFKLFNKAKTAYQDYAFVGNFAPVDKEKDPDNIKVFAQKFTTIYQESSGRFATLNFSTSEWEFKNSFDSNYGVGVQNLSIQLHPKAGFDFQETEYAPPIQESIVTFAGENVECVYPWEFREALNFDAYKGFMNKTDSLVFELVDTMVNLPILPLKLHYSGYFTTVLHQKDVIFKLTPERRYKLLYLNKISETTPMVSGKQLTEYARNIAVSRMLS